MRGFARGLPDDDTDRDHGIFSGRLSIPMVALVSVGKVRWVWGSGVRWKAGPRCAGHLGPWGELHARAPAEATSRVLLPPAALLLFTRGEPAGRIVAARLGVSAMTSFGRAGHTPEAPSRGCAIRPAGSPGGKNQQGRG